QTVVVTKELVRAVDQMDDHPPSRPARRRALSSTISPRSAAGRISKGPALTPGCRDISSIASSMSFGRDTRTSSDPPIYGAVVLCLGRSTSPSIDGAAQSLEPSRAYSRDCDRLLALASPRPVDCRSPMRPLPEPMRPALAALAALAVWPLAGHTDGD